MDPSKALAPIPAEPPQPNVGSTVRASWNFSSDDIRANTAQYPESARSALLSLFMWCNDPRHPMAKPDAARRIGASDNLLYKLYTGKYRNEQGEQLTPAPELVKSIQQFLALEKERFESGETEFVMTPTAKLLSDSCELARKSNTIVFTWGPSHIGKTWALERHAASHNHGRTIYSRLEAASGLGGMVRQIATDCGISAKSNTADLVHRIKNALTKDTLLILDECHLLAYTYRKGSFHNCMEVIREIHDRTKCGLVLCFTILDDVRAASQKELQQLWRRGVHKVPLPLMPTKADLGMIFHHNGLPGAPVRDGRGRDIAGTVFPAADLEITVGKGDRAYTDKPYEVIRQIAKQEGLLAITERLRYGRHLAAKAGEDLTWTHVLRAHAYIAKQATQEGEWK